MPSKADGAAGKGPGVMSTESFLLECIKAGKEKLQVDFNLVAKSTGLSVGGAS